MRLGRLFHGRRLANGHTIFQTVCPATCITTLLPLFIQSLAVGITHSLNGVRCGIILPSSVYDNESARKWVELEVRLARELQKRIIGVTTFGQQEVSSGAPRWWDAAQIIAEREARSPA